MNTDLISELTDGELHELEGILRNFANDVEWSGVCIEDFVEALGDELEKRGIWK